MSSRRGFTLIEILIAVLILGIVLSTVYASYTGTFRIIKDAGNDAEIYGAARSALDRMARDLQSVSPWAGAFDFRTNAEMQGDREFLRLTFRSAAHVAFDDAEIPGGVAVIEYGVEEMPEQPGYALTRSDSLYGEAGKGGPARGRYLLCERIESLEYRFYDEAGREHASWDSGGTSEAQRKKAPAAVLIVLRFVNESNPEHPIAFMTRVRLPHNRPEAS